MTTIPLAEIRHVELFKNLPETELISLINEALEKHYPANQVILEEGDKGCEFFILLSGSVEITKKMPAQTKTDVIEYQHLGHRNSGDFFGEMALIEEKPRSARVTSTTPLKVLVIHKKHFDAFLEKHPHLFLEMMRAFSRRLREANENTIRELETKNKELAALNISLEKLVIDRTSELYQRNIDLEKLNVKKNEILAIYAHDLKNPITVIQGMNSMLANSSPTNLENSLELHQKIDDHCNKMVSIISGLLEISAIEAGKINLRFEATDMSELVQSRVVSACFVASEKNIMVESRLDENLPMLTIDRAKIGEVLDNLLSNAIKFSFPYTSVVVSTEIASQELIIHIQDQGQGLTRDDIKHAFGEFRKLSAVPTGQESSTGLGLAIVKKIMDLHHGRVWVSSPGRNHGATFSIALPRHQDAAVS